MCDARRQLTERPKLLGLRDPFLGLPTIRDVAQHHEPTAVLATDGLRYDGQATILAILFRLKLPLTGPRHQKGRDVRRERARAQHLPINWDEGGRQVFETQTSRHQVLAANDR